MLDDHCAWSIEDRACVSLTLDTINTEIVAHARQYTAAQVIAYYNEKRRLAALAYKPPPPEEMQPITNPYAYTGR